MVISLLFSLSTKKAQIKNSLRGCKNLFTCNRYITTFQSDRSFDPLDKIFNQWLGYLFYLIFFKFLKQGRIVVLK